MNQSKQKIMNQFKQKIFTASLLGAAVGWLISTNLRQCLCDGHNELGQSAAITGPFDEVRHGPHKSQTIAISNSEKKNCKFANKVLGLKSERCAGCFSQRDQDLILQRIFETIGTTNKQCVEFGYGYRPGIEEFVMDDYLKGRKINHGLNVHKLIQEGWLHTFFDAEYSNPKINLIKAVLTEDTIFDEFQKAKIPLDVDYVSIDVDSVDVWLLLGLLKSGYRPRVISVEFNSNWMAHMPVTCRREWAPWNHGSRIYGTSAAAINIVGEKYGYKMVEIMDSLLDVFLIHQDVLQAVCSNINNLPTFEWLGDGILGNNAHGRCDSHEAAMRLVDLPLVLAGDEEGASEKAAEYLRELNQHRKSLGLPPFCDETTKPH